MRIGHSEQQSVRPGFNSVVILIHCAAYSAGMGVSLTLGPCLVPVTQLTSVWVHQRFPILCFCHADRRVPRFMVGLANLSNRPHPR